MTFHVEDKNKTRAGKVRPRFPKKWWGRVVRRELATCIMRLDETVKAFEIREAIAGKKRHRPMRRRFLKALREQDEAERNYIMWCRDNAAKRKRDANGRFLSKRRIRSTSA